MRRWLLVGVLVISLVVGIMPLGGGVEAVGTFKGEGEAVQLVVKLKEWSTVQVERLTSPALGVDVRPVRLIPQLNVLVVRVPADQVEAALRYFRGLPDVVYAEVDPIARVTYVPNDPFYATNQYGPQLIGVEQAWELTQGDPDVLVAVVDTGADFDHPDLAGKLVPGWDFVNNDADPSDDNGHGTHVAGIIAAATDNGVGIAGVGFNTRVLVVKVLNERGSGFYSTIAQGIVYAVDEGARVINLSLRGTLPSNVLADAVNYAVRRGVLVVAAAGNDGQSAPVYPAAYPDVLAVAATDWNDERWSLSNFGDYVDLAAPGVAILSTDWTGGVGPYAMRSGTSMAAPHVAGVAALMLAVNPALTAEAVTELLTSTARDLGAPGWDPYYGYGRVDAARAVQAAWNAARTQELATVGDRVWRDDNANGLQDAGEEGVAGVRVTLYRSDGTPVATVTTDASGAYQFTDVEAGEYYLEVTLPTGYAFTLANQGADDTKDSDVDPATGRTPVFTLNPGDVVTAWDVGLLPTGRLSGLVWLDVNGNGVHDPAENMPLVEVPVQVTGTTLTGMVVERVTTTGTDGRYVVDELPPGTYTVEVPYQYGGYVVTTARAQTIMLTPTLLTFDAVNFGYIAPTVVTLRTFNATTDSGLVVLRWEVALDNGDVPGFFVWRSGQDGEMRRLTPTPLLPEWENGRVARYRFVDTTVQPGETYTYRLDTVDGQTFGPWQVTLPLTVNHSPTLRVFLPLMSGR